MMISEGLAAAMSKQVVAEFYSSYLYLSMSAWFDSRGLSGFANWMKTQAQEELTHGGKIFNYIGERDAEVELGSIEAPPAKWDSPLAAFKAAYQHEQKVTGMINDLVAMARDERDFASESFLQWFVNEQVEEESTAKGIVDQLTIAGDHPQALLMLDRELGQRVFAMPAAAE